jgi:hypothetical protein
MRGDRPLPWAALAALIGCNLVTGADAIQFDEGGGAAGPSAATSASATTSTQSAGGATAADTGVTATSTIAAASTTVAASSSTGSACVYPSGPYGVNKGATVPPTVTWKGYPAGGLAQGTLSTKELFDCDGTKGITAIVFDTSQFG